MERSFLSDDVKQLICDSGAECCLPALTDYIRLPQGTIKWQAIQQCFIEVLPNNYTEYVKRLRPICASISNWMQTLTREEFNVTFLDNLLWTGQQELFKECFEVLQCKCIGSIHVSCLLTTAALEKALGDVYLTMNGPCPRLLKELLITPELCTVFGSTAMELLHILIGPPTSLNLRNIFWHGFASPGEVPKMYAYFLIVVTASFGELLCYKQILSVPHRPWLNFSSIHRTSTVVKVIEGLEKAIMMSTFKNSDFIPKDMIPIWETAVEYFFVGRYGLCVMLLLPQLEMSIRRIFVKINDCPQRLVTAEKSTLFTTFDEMLCSQLTDEKANALIAKVGDNYMEMLMDLLVYKSGPRLRNHLSHGEVDFFDVNKDVANFVLYICLSWTCLFLEKHPTDSKKIISIENLRSNANYYSSIYHPKVILQRNLFDLFSSLNKWQEITFPTTDQLKCEHVPDPKLAEMLLSSLCKVCNRDVEAHDLNSLESFTAVMPLSTLFRPKIELEVTAVLQKIVLQCKCMSENVLKITQLRYQQLLNKELRSRQRKNYTVLISSIPVFSNVALVVCAIVATQLSMTTGLSELDSPSKLSLIKFLKEVLQFTENIATNTSIERNKWSDGLTLITSFLIKLNKFYIK